MYVKPAPGLKVRDPDLMDFLPEGGREVLASLFWHRRVRDRDVTLGTPAAVAAIPPADAAPAPTEQAD